MLSGGSGGKWRESGEGEGLIFTLGVDSFIRRCQKTKSSTKSDVCVPTVRRREWGGQWVGGEGGGESHVISRRKAWLAPERQCFMGQNCVTDGSLNYKVRARLKSRG